MGAEKWLDIELWDSTKECFDALKLRGYRIATTHVRIDAVKYLMTITSVEMTTSQILVNM